MPEPLARVVGERIHRARLALRLGRGARALLRLLAWSLAGLTLLALLAWLGWLPDRVVPAAAALAALSLLLAALDARRLTLADAALALDRRLGLDERGLTALRVIDAAAPGPNVRQVIAEAAARLPAHPWRLFRLGLARPALVLAALGAALAVVVTLPPRPVPVPPRVSVDAQARASGRKLAEQARKLESEARRSRIPEAAAAARKLGTVANGLASGRLRKGEALAAVRDAKRSAGRAFARSPLAASLPHLDRATRELAGAAATQDLARAMRAGDEAELAQRMEDLARSLESGGFEAKALEPLARALESMAQALEAAGRRELAGLAREAARAAQQGDARQVAQKLREMKEKGAGEYTAQAGECGKAQNQLADLVREAEQALGARAQPLSGADYGQGSSNAEAAPFPVTEGPRNRDRDLPLTSRKTRGYDAAHAPRAGLDGKFEASRVGGQPGGSGEMSYIETRAAAGKARLQLARDAVPGTTVESAEEALTREEVPPGFREQVRQYFDTVPDQEK